MRDMYGPLVLMLVMVVAVSYYVWTFLRDERQRRLVVGYCASMGWRYTGEDDSFAYRWNGTPFGEGDRRRARNVVRGYDHGVPFVAFDYQYDTETSDGQGRKARTTHHFGVAALALPGVLPRLQVTPEGVLERAAAAVGLGGGIELESEDFNRRYVVHARDPKFASDVLTPRTMEALLAGPPLAWRIEVTDVVCWWSGRMHPVELAARLSTLRKVVEGIPSFVWHDNGVRTDGVWTDGVGTDGVGTAPSTQVAAPPPLVPPGPPAADNVTHDTVTHDPQGVENGDHDPRGVENVLDHGAVFSPHTTATVAPAPPAEGSSA
jgi:hypothetical protein